MTTRGRVLLGGVGLFLLACAGKNLTEVGELNHGGAGNDAPAGGGMGPPAEGGQPGGGTSDSGGTRFGIAGANAGGADTQEMPEAAGAGGGETFDPGTVFEEGASEVMAVTGSTTTLYWVEHGTEDSLGNYQNDGRLMARDFDSEESRVVADDLPGPVGVALTTDHVFVYVDSYEDGGTQAALVRLPITGGTPALIQLGARPYSGGGGVCPSCFVHDGDAGYFPFDEKIYRVGSEDSEAELFADLIPYRLAAGEDALYALSEGGIWTIPYTTGVPDNLTTEPRSDIQIGGDYLYGIESGNGSLYLSRMPLAGGAWVRLPPKRSADYSWRLQVLDGLFFHDAHPETGWQLVQGQLSAPEGAGIVLDLVEPSTRRIWIGTHAGVFWNDGSRVMHAPLAAE